jgi:hypothetical protein
LKNWSNINAFNSNIIRHCYPGKKNPTNYPEFLLRDKFFNAWEAKDFGIVDEVIGNASDMIMLKKQELSLSLMDGKEGERRGGWIEAQVYIPGIIDAYEFWSATFWQ